MAQRLNPGILGAAIVCFVMTAAFTAGFISKNGEVTRLRDGDPETPSAPTVTKQLDERIKLKGAIAALEQDVRLRQREVERIEVQLSAHHILYEGDSLLSGIALKEGETDTIRGAQVPLNMHRLSLSNVAVNASANRLEALKTEYASASRQEFPPLDEAIAKRNAELQAVSQRISAQDAEFQKDRAALNEKLDALKAEKDKNDKSNREEMAKRQTRIAQLEDKIRDLLELDLRWLAEVEAIGAVLTVEESSQRLIVNLGASERSFPGLLLEVFNWEKGAYIEKGMVEVIEVKDGVSICRIISQKNPRLHPLSRDDRVGNPTFNPRRPKSFMVAGEFERYNKSDLEAFIRRSGGVVVDKLSPGVDFLVAGNRSDRDQAQAREFHVLGIREAQLLKYIQPSFPPTTGARK